MTEIFNILPAPLLIVNSDLDIVRYKNYELIKIFGDLSDEDMLMNTTFRNKYGGEVTKPDVEN